MATAELNHFESSNSNSDSELELKDYATSSKIDSGDRKSSKVKSKVKNSFDVYKENHKKLKLEQAAKFVPEFNGKRDDLSKFISCGDFAIENVSNSYKYLLFEIIKNKLVGDAYNIVRFKDVESWEQLKVALHDKYGEKKNIAHLQLEVSSARQNKDEDVRAFSERLNSIHGCLLYTSMLPWKPRSLRFSLRSPGWNCLSTCPRGPRSPP